MIDRREALKWFAGGASFALPAVSSADDEVRRTGLGLVVYCQQFERAARKGSNLFEPGTFLEHCHRLGAGGIQAPLGVMEPAAARQLRERAEGLGMFVEAIVTRAAAAQSLQNELDVIAACVAADESAASGKTTAIAYV